MKRYRPSRSLQIQLRRTKSAVDDWSEARWTERVAIGERYRVSKASWQGLLLDLKGRGLQAGRLLAVGNGEMGFWAALEEVFPATRGKRYWFHKMGNLLNALRKSRRGAPRRMCGAIWMAATRDNAYTGHSSRCVVAHGRRRLTPLVH